MKNKFLIVFKNSIMNSYKLRSLTKRKVILVLILAAYIIVSLYMIFNDFFLNIYEKLNLLNLANYYLIFLFIIVSFLSFFFTIFTAKNALFENKDNNLLFSLPIKKKIILLNRLTNLLLFNFLISFLVMLPGLYIYITNSDLSFNIIITILILILFVSFIPTILSCLFGYLIAIITSRSKNKNIIELLSYITFIALYFLIIYKGDILLTKLFNNPDLLNKLLKVIFYPIYLIYLAISNNNLLYLIIFILINILVIYIFIMLLDKIYYNLIIKLNTSKTNNKFIMHKNKINKPLLSLIKKELRRYFSSAIYVFNTSFGVLMLLIISFASIFYSSDKIMSILDLDIQTNSSLLILYLIIMVIAFSVTTNSSISIERNNFWILKMLPFKTKNIFLAKKMVNLVLLIPVIFLSLIIFILTNYITISEALYILIIAVILSITIANFGLIINLLFPKFDAPNDTVIVKQSPAAFIGIMIPMIFFGMYIGLIFSLSYHIQLLISLVLSLLLLIISSIILNTWGIKKYQAL